MPMPFDNAVMTDGGAALLAKATAGECKIEFTKMAIGDGTYSEDEKTIAALQARTDLKDHKNDYKISGCSVYTEKSVKVTALLSNMDPLTYEAIITDGYYINEVGLYAKEADGSEDTEVLYAIAITSGEQGDYMPPYNGYNPAEITQDFYVTVDNSANVSIDSAGAAFTVDQAEEMKEELDEKIALLDDLLDLSQSHNQIYRGKYLGDQVTDEQYEAIDAGTFDDMYIGDYWTINGFDWVIADFDYWYHCGDTDFSKHHILIVPSTMLYYNTYMNASNTTEGGYIGSYMYTDGLAQAKSMINSAFGEAHIANHRNWFTNAVTSGYPSAGEWVDSTVDLMNEEMVYGCPIRQQMSYGGTAVNNYTIDKSQLALFRYDRAAVLAFGNGDNGGSVGTRYTWWLRGVVSATYFAIVGYYGTASYGNASSTYGVRPCFAIVKS